VWAAAIGVVFSYGVWIGAISPAALNASVLFLWTSLVVIYVVGRVVWEHLDHL
jgi:hypothetical protein